jgi:iron(III) transport system ATP-binding protein
MTATDTASRVGRTPHAESPVVRIRGLCKRFRRNDRTFAHAIDGVDLDVAPDDFLVLLGPSGCGKTTLLRSIAGLETPDEGTIAIADRPVFDAARKLEVAPEHRGISMMFQSYALWPHMSVQANVAYPLENRRGGRVPRREIADRVTRALELVGIGELAKQFPGEMSGGQQQRVALARALVAGDGLVLFDEPLSNVDAKVRERLRVDLLAMQRRLRFAAVYVTHDQTEAMELATRIAVLRDGRIVQLGTPREIYERPATRYVANFVGVANEIPGTVLGTDNGTIVLDTPCGRIGGLASPELPPRVGERAVAVWRPEHGRLSATEPSTPNRWPVQRQVSLFAGPHTEHHLTSPDGVPARIWTPTADVPGDELWLSVPPETTRILPFD